MAGIYNYPDKNVWTFVRVENDSLVTGYRQTTGWGRTRTVYFALSFSRPFKTYGSRNYDKKEAYRGFWGRFDQQHNWPDLAAHQLRLHFDFGPTTAGEQVKLKMALSPVSTAGALANLRAEAPGWNFADYKQKGQAHVAAGARAKLSIQSPRRVDKENFYTAMYHAFIGTTIYQDVDGQFRGLDQNNHTSQGLHQLHHLFALGYLPGAAPALQPGAAAAQRRHGPEYAHALRPQRRAHAARVERTTPTKTGA